MGIDHLVSRVFSTPVIYGLRVVLACMTIGLTIRFLLGHYYIGLDLVTYVGTIRVNLYVVIGYRFIGGVFGGLFVGSQHVARIGGTLFSFIALIGGVITHVRVVRGVQ